MQFVPHSCTAYIVKATGLRVTNPQGLKTIVAPYGLAGDGDDGVAIEDGGGGGALRDRHWATVGIGDGDGSYLYASLIPEVGVDKGAQ